MKTTTRLDGSTVYRTLDGDTVDFIANAFYGTHAGTTSLLYAANPFLPDLPFILSAGVEVILPPLQRAAPTPVISLWD